MTENKIAIPLERELLEQMELPELLKRLALLKRRRDALTDNRPDPHEEFRRSFEKLRRTLAEISTRNDRLEPADMLLIVIRRLEQSLIRDMDATTVQATRKQIRRITQQVARLKGGKEQAPTTETVH